MSPSEIEPTLPESGSVEQPSSLCITQTHMGENRRFSQLRGVEWRINLGILPSSSSASIDDIRRVTANSRRRYAGLRRRLLVDPHVSKDGSNSRGITMDNPLSQNPDSTWGRFFRNAELEKMVDQDLSRLYPERGSYFQTSGCQGMLRRILLLWCLQHPENGYRQGMHELLAPLLYVLHVDVNRLTQVRKLFEDHFTDKFDGLSFHDSNLTYDFDFKRPPDSAKDEIGSHGNAVPIRSLDELDPEIQTVVLLSDAYGAEGELGIVLSEKFMEHDAYCMFDALMSGSSGAVAMADFFSPSPAGGSHTGLPPVIEASAALYQLLSLVDSSLYTHLVELGVEPQYFSLRWLRVLFGREFSLEDLLIIWDEIFASDNSITVKGDTDEVGSSFVFLSSSRGAFISAIAVSMLLYLRSSLLATENATSCLQRLLNFPDNIDLKKLIEKAKSLQTLALNANISSLPPSFGSVYGHSKSMAARGHSLSYDFAASRTPLNLVPESYWEEKWRDLHREEELKQDGSKKQTATHKRGWSGKVRFLSRTESDPCPAKLVTRKKETKSSVRRRLLDDLSKVLGSEEDEDKKLGNDEVSDEKDNLSAEDELHRQDDSNKDVMCTTENVSFLGNTRTEEDSSISSDPASFISGDNDHENDSGRSSVASNLSIDDSDDQSQPILEDQTLPLSDHPEHVSEKSVCNIHDSEAKSVPGTKDRKLLTGKFPWFWKFGRNNAGEETSDKGNFATGAPKPANGESNQSSTSSSPVDGCRNSSDSSKGDDSDQNVMGTLRNLGQSMLEHIQVIESAFQQDRGVHVGSLENLSKNGLVEKGQVTAISALKELRKISNLLSEM